MSMHHSYTIALALHEYRKACAAMKTQQRQLKY